MYICSCHAVTDGAIRAHIKSGTRTFAQLAKQTGVATQCGICGRQAKELFYQILEQETGIKRQQPATPAAASAVQASAPVVENSACATAACGRAVCCFPQSACCDNCMLSTVN